MNPVRSLHLTALHGSDILSLGAIRHYPCDIASATSVKEVAASVRSTFGNPTILINNAGIATGFAILSSTDESVQRTFDVNTFSHFRLVREFVPAMVSANHGTIVTIASLAAVVSTSKIVDYSCSKSAALSFHEGLAAELKVTYKAPKVRTLCVCPSWVQTSLVSPLHKLSARLRTLCELLPRRMSCNVTCIREQIADSELCDRPVELNLIVNSYCRC